MSMISRTRDMHQLILVSAWICTLALQQDTRTDQLVWYLCFIPVICISWPITYVTGAGLVLLWILHKRICIRIVEGETVWSASRLKVAAEFAASLWLHIWIWDINSQKSVLEPEEESEDEKWIEKRWNGGERWRDQSGYSNRRRGWGWVKQRADKSAGLNYCLLHTLLSLTHYSIHHEDGTQPGGLHSRFSSPRSEPSELWGYKYHRAAACSSFPLPSL